MQPIPASDVKPGDVIKDPVTGKVKTVTDKKSSFLKSFVSLEYENGNSSLHVSENIQVTKIR